MKLVLYIVICAWLFAFLDWQSIHLTRWQSRELLDWAHAHEQQYATVTRAAELIICTPAMSLKPIFQDIMMQVEASREEQEAITHAPTANTQGFYHLPKRGESWTFVSWASWFTYWIPPSILWWMITKRITK